uniref:Uncharacterized protein n=1 Tax=Glossina brevipalpis TaxID=37001 RepID=A0A1A9WLY4_9MUSC
MEWPIDFVLELNELKKTESMKKKNSFIIYLKGFNKISQPIFIISIFINNNRNSYSRESVVIAISIRDLFLNPLFLKNPPAPIKNMCITDQSKDFWIQSSLRPPSAHSRSVSILINHSSSHRGFYETFLTRTSISI